jgi:hypothetical protein
MLVPKFMQNTWWRWMCLQMQSVGRPVRRLQVRGVFPRLDANRRAAYLKRDRGERGGRR